MPENQNGLVNSASNCVHRNNLIGLFKLIQEEPRIYTSKYQMCMNNKGIKYCGIALSKIIVRADAKKSEWSCVYTGTTSLVCSN
jgi:hypothetical protein